MHMPTGEISQFDNEDALKAGQIRLIEAHQKPLLELSGAEFKELEPMSRPERKNRMRNKPCVCGSGQKFKRCCWSKFA